MEKSFIVKKRSGEGQEFSPEKLRMSLKRSGASDVVADEIIVEIGKLLYDGISTKIIYKKAFGLLRKFVRNSAARYSLKSAIMEMGPSGHPFERLVGEIIHRLGYKAEVGVTFRGRCVTHELDVLARNSQEMFMVECKYYNSPGKNCNVQVPLYIHSRFNDVKAVWEARPENQGLKFSCWVVTNTRFTSDAADYGKCVGLKLISWDYPIGGSIRDLIEQMGLFPVTALTTLTRKQKDSLLEANVILCSHIVEKPEVLEIISPDGKKNEKILAEAIDLCVMYDGDN